VRKRDRDLHYENGGPGEGDVYRKETAAIKKVAGEGRGAAFRGKNGRDSVLIYESEERRRRD